MTEKTKCTTKSQHKIGDKSFQNVAKFRYMGMTLTTHNYPHTEIKIRLNSRTACYHLAQIFFFFWFAF
jgi:hypothetical protein